MILNGVYIFAPMLNEPFRVYPIGCRRGDVAELITTKDLLEEEIKDLYSGEKAANKIYRSRAC